MQLTPDKIKKCQQRLLLARQRLLLRQGFYGMLITHLTFTLIDSIDTAKCNDERLSINPEFLLSLNDKELDYVLIHNVLHVALRHHKRAVGKVSSVYNDACDLVVNSLIYTSSSEPQTSILLSGYGGQQPHMCSGFEACLYSAEEIYQLMMETRSTDLPDKGGLSGLETDEKPQGFRNWDNHDDWQSKNMQAPPDARSQKEGQEHGNPSDANAGGDAQGQEGKGDQLGQNGSSCTDKSDASNEQTSQNSAACSAQLQDYQWQNYVKQAAEIASARDEILSIEDPSASCGNCPGFAKRMLQSLREGKLDWRTLLQDFLQQEVCDFSFAPPDKRYADSDFFLPDYNETQDMAANLWFVVDASGSMSDKQIADVFSEIKAALEQFDGHLSGWVSFFDVSVTPPAAIESVDDLLALKPLGGGGTSLASIFEYLAHDFKLDLMRTPLYVATDTELPALIVILTDGYCDFPDEDAALGIPVLWLINNTNITPPWGKVGRIE